MAGGRRHLQSRGHPIRPPSLTSACEDGRTGRTGGTELASAPKHIPMPPVNHDGELLYECIMFAYTVVSCAMQFLHLYRSVWWLPTSYSQHAMNFYLVDMHLLGFIATILARQVVYCALRKLLLRCTPQHLWPTTERSLRVVLLSVVVAVLAWCALVIIRTHQLVNILYLGYPMSVYFILFGLHIGPFFSSSDHGHEQIEGDIAHNCPTSASGVRGEVERLKLDFNARMRHVLFSSVLSAYYAGFVPCCFAQSSLVYDLTWVTQHLGFVWLGCFTMAAVHAYPVQYVDVLHRASVHLGRWSKLEGCRSHLPTHTWVEGTVWPSGSLVRHSREIFRAEGVQSVSAEPGNSAHARFYMVFHNPGLLLGALLVLQGILVAAQLFLLAQMGSEWWRNLSLALMLFVNYYTLFKLVRDTAVCWKHFHNEKVLHSKLASG